MQRRINLERNKKHGAMFEKQQGTGRVYSDIEKAEE
jgi:hypothetical protein